MILNDNGEQMVEHHIKYKEIHGVDETVMMTRSEHQQLHNRLRSEGKCNIPPDELATISTAAIQRTDKYKKYQRDYSKQKYHEHCMNVEQMVEVPHSEINVIKPTCTICGKQKMVRCGLLNRRTTQYQMYKCNECGHRQRGELLRAVKQDKEDIVSDERTPCNSPSCNSTNTVKAGPQTFRGGIFQMWKCNECGRRFKGELIKAVTV